MSTELIYKIEELLNIATGDGPIKEDVRNVYTRRALLNVLEELRDIERSLARLEANARSEVQK